MRRLECVVQEYDWGHPTWIPDLLGEPERKGRPNAELWMGAHAKAPSIADGVRLDALAAAEPDAVLGQGVTERFGELPYLFKVIAIDRALSIQTHPSSAQAQVGFDREAAAGVALDAPERTYRDHNHKPELLCALTPIDALCGFRPVVEARAFVEALGTDALRDLAAVLDGGGTEVEILAAALQHLLRLPSGEVHEILAELVPALAHCADPRFADAARALWWVADDFPGDVGVAVGLLLNHVTIEPGQALFLGPGNLHAYLSGVGVELMANSDNVIRGGLTPKHIDVEELLAVVDCTPLDPPVETAIEPVHTYCSPVDEFRLTRVDLSAGGQHRVAGPAIVLLTSGRAGTIEKGQPVFVAASDEPLHLEGTGLAWVASVGFSS